VLSGGPAWPGGFQSHQVTAEHCGHGQLKSLIDRSLEVAQFGTGWIPFVRPGLLKFKIGRMCCVGVLICVYICVCELLLV
jgi:hypothetical protein